MFVFMLHFQFFRGLPLLSSCIQISLSLPTTSSRLAIIGFQLVKSSATGTFSYYDTYPLFLLPFRIFGVVVYKVSPNFLRFWFVSCFLLSQMSECWIFSNNGIDAWLASKHLKQKPMDHINEGLHFFSMMWWV